MRGGGESEGENEDGGVGGSDIEDDIGVGVEGEDGASPCWPIHLPTRTLTNPFIHSLTKPLIHTHTHPKVDQADVYVSKQLEALFSQ